MEESININIAIMKYDKFYYKKQYYRMKNIKSKKGYLLVEAAIFLPLFIIAVLSMAYMIKYAMVSENVSQITFDETRVYIKEIYISSTIGNERGKIKERLEIEMPQISEVKVSNILPFILSPDENYVFSYDIEYNVKVPVPIFIEDTKGRQRIVFRPFVGKDNSTEKLMNPDEKEEYKEVFVFPRAGERYHKADCIFIKSYAREERMGSKIKLKYDPCRLCDAKNIKTGETVYFFMKSGEKYHTPKCSIVDKYVITMDLQDAEAKGYTSCKKCGGYGD